jgi:hypothetical protein
VPAPERADVVARPRPSIRRIAIWTASLVLLVGAVVAGITYWLGRGGTSRTSPQCWVASGPHSVSLVDIEQAENATTITAVAKQLGMPDHAVTIALAAALQESQLRNLRYGDRDSLGLFQQRPSQGWGTPAQLVDPQYAAGAFFKALARVSGWESLPVTQAAQSVQRSSAPDAYATWEPLARSLAIATTGEQAVGLTCQYEVRKWATPAPSVTPALTQAFGPSALGAPGSRTRGWTIAAWLVAHARQYRIISVRYAGREWTPDGSWSKTPTTDGITITQSAIG